MPKSLTMLLQGSKPARKPAAKVRTASTGESTVEAGGVAVAAPAIVKQHKASVRTKKPAAKAAPKEGGAV